MIQQKIVHMFSHPIFIYIYEHVYSGECRHVSWSSHSLYKCFFLIFLFVFFYFRVYISKSGILIRPQKPGRQQDIFIPGQPEALQFVTLSALT